MSANFRTRMFGGFDREDVVAYIGKITKENQAQVEELTSAADELRLEAENQSAQEALRQCRARGDELPLQAD